ncbi:VWA domain-containing protein [Parasediminibacterium paludis]|uniref:VWA domain-containing protein n=1 Tax=Parasediminibacterium paludis TaxID=908966 RepID=A0ABV8PZW7_9BACT
MLQFQYIEFLFGLAILLPLVGLFLFVIHWKKKKQQQLGDNRLVTQLTSNYSHQKYQIKIVAVIVCIGLLILSAANLRMPLLPKGSATKGVDVMILLDVSKSMLSEDEKPTRLDKAKELIYQLLDKLQGNRVGLILFAGQAYLQMPLTADVTAAKMFVSNANTDVVNLQGTVISEALTLCNNSLDVREKKYKAAILITDGEDHEEKAVETAKTLTETGVVLHTIGVGTVGGATIKEAGTNDAKRDVNGETIITKLNPDLLEELSKTTGGTYQTLNKTDEVSARLINTLKEMETKPINNSGFVDYQSYYTIFLAIGVALLLVEIFISEKKTI